mmetsp:Transcript_2726/g.10065  ORF Transcript_2726/g.10065 Transcript_2726/m.10065 type:complete len:378 (-) Transcript_2726:436-1569(-)
MPRPASDHRHRRLIHIPQQALALPLSSWVRVRIRGPSFPRLFSGLLVPSNQLMRAEDPPPQRLGERGRGLAGLGAVLHLDLALDLPAFRNFQQFPLHQRDHLPPHRVILAPDVHGEVCVTRNHVRSSRKDVELAHRAHEHVLPRQGELVALVLYPRNHLRARSDGVPPLVHGHRPSVAREAVHLDVHPGLAADSAHHPDRLVQGLQHGALLNVDLHVAVQVFTPHGYLGDVLLRVAQANGLKHAGQSVALAVRGLEVPVLEESAGDGPAAQKGGFEPQTLLVTERDDLDGPAKPKRGVRVQPELQVLDRRDGGHDAEGAVVRPPVHDRVDVRAQEKDPRVVAVLALLLEPAVQVAHAVEPGPQTSILHPPAYAGERP